MSGHPSYVKAKIGGHPIHPMIVSFPIAFYTVGLVALIVYAATRDAFWYRAAMILWFTGAASAVVAGVFGAIDLFLGIPSRTRAYGIGAMHFGANVAAMCLFAGAAFMMYGDWHARPPSSPLLRIDPPLVLGFVGLALTLAAGALGYTLVQTEHVGVDVTQPEPDAAL